MGLFGGLEGELCFEPSGFGFGSMALEWDRMCEYEYFSTRP